MRHTAPSLNPLLSLLLLLPLAAACGDDDDDSPPPLRLEVPIPSLEGPVTGGNGIVLQGTGFALADVGYEREEFFVSGTARSFANAGDLDSDGDWQVEEASSAEYKTRIVVHRPIDAADFGGSVMVEWLNVSAGFDSAPDWISGHVELVRRGWIWVGVSAQFVGVEGNAGPGPIPGLDFSLKRFDPVRYGSLSHPGDSYSYDIFSQVGRVLRDGAGVDPFGGLVPAAIIAAGESQSAFRMVTYVNAFAGAAGIYDGYLVHSRGGGSAALSQAPQAQIGVPDVVRIRTDLEVPVLTFQTETDLTLLGSAPDRQDDSAYFRWWEVAGTAHADLYTLLGGMTDVGGDPSVAAVREVSAPIPGIIECDNPINSGPQHFVLKAAIRALEEWVREGVPAPQAPRLALAGDPPAFVVDELGNAIGGIRTPYVDVPIARLTGASPGGSTFCFLFGTTNLLDQATIDELYPDHASYVAAVEQSAQEALEIGFLLEADVDLIVAAAEMAAIP
jgi:hypothetical protein